MSNRSPLELYNGCDKKKAYENEEVANGAITEMIRNKKKPQYSYDCPRCSAWHLTKKKSWTKGKGKMANSSPESAELKPLKPSPMPRTE